MSELRAEPVLSLHNITKSYPGVRALVDVDLDVRPGEVHALVGENGSGKSTLIKVANGTVAPDSGTVRIGGVRLGRAAPHRAQALGVFTAYQDASLVPAMSVADNLVLSLRRGGLGLGRDEAVMRLETLGLSLPPRALVGDLDPGSRQLLEVARAMLHEPRALLLDEPTAALGHSSIDRLEALIRRAVERGTGVLYVSHRLGEVERLADRVTILRDGQVQTTVDRRGWDVARIVSLMAGTEVDLIYPPRRTRPRAGPPALQAEAIAGPGFGPVSLEVRAGEIVGLAGAEGNGQREILRALIGVGPVTGAVRVDGRAAPLRHPGHAQRRGVSFQGGDRALDSVFAEISVMTNTTLPMTRGLGPAALVRRRREVTAFDTVRERLRIVAASPDQPIRQLSGGNQQKSVLGRALLRPSRVLIIDEPTQGVDARARLDIYRAIRDQADAGTAVVLNSSDSAELAGMCDRVYVISRGRIVRELAGDDLAESTIVDAFVNATAVEPAAAVSPARLRIRDVAGRWLHQPWFAPAMVAALIVLVSLYASVTSPVFFTESNLSALLMTAVPLAFVVIGQQAVLLTGGFDISVGALMTLTVVVGSYTLAADSFAGAIPGVLLCLATGVAAGLLNWFVVRLLGISAIIATIATMGLFQGISVLVRPEPGGFIGAGLMDAFSAHLGAVPIAFLAAVAICLTADVWRTRTTSGLSTVAVGLHEESARRTGVRVERIKIGGFVACSAFAAIAGLLLAVQIGIGSNNVGAGFALPAFTACFLGGASLTGGRGSFSAALLGAVFITLLTNVAPLTGIPDAVTQVVIGLLTVAAVAAYRTRLKTR